MSLRIYTNRKTSGKLLTYQQTKQIHLFIHSTCSQVIQEIKIKRKKNCWWGKHFISNKSPNSYQSTFVCHPTKQQISSYSSAYFGFLKYIYIKTYLSSKQKITKIYAAQQVAPVIITHSFESLYSNQSDIWINYHLNAWDEYDMQYKKRNKQQG